MGLVDNLNEPNRLFGWNRFTPPYQKGGSSAYYYVDLRAFPGGDGSPSSRSIA